MSRFKPYDTTLTPAQDRLIAAMLSSTTVRDAAKKANLSEKTSWTYLALPQVKAALQQARDDIRTQAIDLLKGQMLQSVQTIIEVRDDEENQPQVRLKAAFGVLELATKSEASQQAEDGQEQSGNNLRDLLGLCTNEELAIILPVINAVSARKREAEEKITPIRHIG